MTDVVLTPGELATAGRARAALARQLTQVGALHDPAWRHAVTDVARHVLIPRYFETDPTAGWCAVDSTLARMLVHAGLTGDKSALGGSDARAALERLVARSRQRSPADAVALVNEARAGLGADR